MYRIVRLAYHYATIASRPTYGAGGDDDGSGREERAGSVVVGVADDLLDRLAHHLDGGEGHDDGEDDDRHRLQFRPTFNRPRKA